METIFKCMVGSHAYGTNIETSDTDYKGVYLQPLKECIGWGYKEQIDVSKDEVYYEVKRFLELAMKGNPTMLELLFMPDNMVEISTPTWELIREHKQLFLTKQCRNSFGGYALQQIRKAKGLDKKMNWENDRVERKDVIDFCYISIAGKSVKLAAYLKDQNINPVYCGMIKLDHMADCYAIYHDSVSQWAKEGNHRFKDESGEVPSLGFKGIQSVDGNQLILSSIPKFTIPCEGTVYFNKSEWSSHCSDFKSYEVWLKEHNEQRYVDTLQHGQKVDGKNLLHCRRLIDVAFEIAQFGEFNVHRPNAAYLLDIRKGKVRLDDIIKKAEQDIIHLDKLYASSGLPDSVDVSKVEELLFKIRGL